ncbi:hypothetical protein BCR43DRAFT_543639 [Syncephalastrum racemosum]|uniref:SWIM-type domain-containing protein n=1 Tax=Syncephalastrum racemosum TaxID=13706 RepID=A0A1X2HHW1_SYNRA|nr:hypothetical protein BCR43DRAFT_543639 [Syncephalastrum racemosum]
MDSSASSLTYSPDDAYATGPDIAGGPTGQSNGESTGSWATILSASYRSVDDAYNLVQTYAHEHGFSITKEGSDHRRCYFLCLHSGHVRTTERKREKILKEDLCTGFTAASAGSSIEGYKCKNGILKKFPQRRSAKSRFIAKDIVNQRTRARAYESINEQEMQSIAQYFDDQGYILRYDVDTSTKVIKSIFVTHPHCVERANMFPEDATAVTQYNNEVLSRWVMKNSGKGGEDKELVRMLSSLTGSICQYAISKTATEIIASRSLTDTDMCDCEVRVNFKLLCRHQLFKLQGHIVVPSMYDSRWTLQGSRVNLAAFPLVEEQRSSVKQEHAMLSDLSKAHDRYQELKDRVDNAYRRCESNQQRSDLLKSISDALYNFEIVSIADMKLPAETVTKGRPKKSIGLRKPSAFELAERNDKEREKDKKKTKKRKQGVRTPTSSAKDSELILPEKRRRVTNIICRQFICNGSELEYARLQERMEYGVTSNTRTEAQNPCASPDIKFWFDGSFDIQLAANTFLRPIACYSSTDGYGHESRLHLPHGVPEKQHAPVAMHFVRGNHWEPILTKDSPVKMEWPPVTDQHRAQWEMINPALHYKKYWRYLLLQKEIAIPTKVPSTSTDPSVQDSSQTETSYVMSSVDESVECPNCFGQLRKPFPSTVKTKYDELFTNTDVPLDPLLSHEFCKLHELEYEG